MATLMQNVASAIQGQAVSMFGTGPASAIANVALGIFGGTAQGRNAVTPVAGNIGSISGAVAVPQNGQGVGIFNQVTNSNPIGNLVGQIGGNLVQQAVQFTSATKTGIVPVANNVLPAVKALGLPVSPVAVPIQQKSLTLSGAVNDVQKRIDQAQGSSGDDLLTLLGLAGVAKWLGLW